MKRRGAGRGSAGSCSPTPSSSSAWSTARVTLIDEVLSPDSSRYWDRAEYEAGRLLSFDKQYVRDWLDRSGWNHEPPAPALPPDVRRAHRERYLEAMRRITGDAA